MSLSLPHPAALPAVLSLSEESADHAERFLGVPLWIWQLLNLLLFLAVLLYFVAKPLAEAFRRRQIEIEERRREAERQRAEVERLTAEIRERTARLEREIEEVRRQAVEEGESARADLAERAKEEAERVRMEAQLEIERRLAAAKDELRATASELTAVAAIDLLSGHITEDDRQRLLAESMARLKSAR